MLSNRITELAQHLGDALNSKGLYVSTAESCTGGGIAEAITRVAGSSAWFEAGFVTYSNQMKTQLLGVPSEVLAQVGAVSEPVVVAMAQGALKLSGAHLAVAVSGVAGPGGGSPKKPVGTVWLAFATAQGTVTECAHFAGDRNAVRKQTIVRALTQLIELTAREKSKRG